MLRSRLRQLEALVNRFMELDLAAGQDAHRWPARGWGLGATLATRLKRWEAIARRKVTPRHHFERRTEAEWLILFEEWGRQGFFQEEADFGFALAFYREALAQAQARLDPAADSRDELIDFGTKFPEVRGGWLWLMRMALRRMRNQAPMADAPFKELAEWFSGNAAFFAALPSSAERLLDVGDGQKVNVTDLRWALKEGPGNMLCMNARGVCVTHVMEDLRRLKGEYPAGLPLRSPNSFEVSSRGASSST